MKSSGVGGQAVIEGVMMRSGSTYAVAVRKPDQEIVLEKGTYVSAKEKHTICRVPIIRGMVTFVESLVLGMKTLTFSSKFFEEEERENDKKPASEKTEAFVTGLTVLFSILIAVGVFMLLPLWLVNLLSGVIQSQMALAVLEGAVRLLIFIGYIVAISQMKDIKRLFMYHGAEHKVINCIEQGRELTYSNIRKQSRYHKRCGTNFTMIVMLISVILFLFIHTETLWLRYVLRILLIPVISGISYEFILLAGKSESKIMTVLSKPGLWLQSLTTREPDKHMIEVAVCALEAVFDWREFQEDQATNRRKNKKVEQKKKEEQKPERKSEETLAASEPVQGVTITEYQARENKEKPVAKAVSAADAKKAVSPVREKKTELDEEEDEILKALDRYFEYNGTKTVMEDIPKNKKEKR